MKNNTYRTGILCSAVAIGLSAALGLNAAQAAPFKPVNNARFDVLTAKAQDQGTVRVIVRLKEGQSVKSSNKSMGIQAYQASVASTQSQVMSTLAQPTSVRTFKTIPYIAMEVDAIDLSALRQSPEVEAVFEDRMQFLDLAQSVPIIGADRAAAAGYSGAGQTVVVLDTGVDSTHPDLAGKVIAEACFSSGSADGVSTGVCPNGQATMIGAGAATPCKADGCNHGTHVAGTAAGRQGVARDANIIAVQVFSQVNSTEQCSQTGHSTPCTTSWVSDSMAALEYVYSLNAQLDIAAINMSLGGGRHTQACEADPQKPIIDNLYAAGIATVISSGNSSYIDAVGSPSCIASAVTVGATDKQDWVADFSNSSQSVDLLAPGVGITSSVPGGYGVMNGTSMAAPHVAGAFAVLKAAASTASVDILHAALHFSGKPITDNRNGITRSRIQVDAALNFLSQ